MYWRVFSEYRTPPYVSLRKRSNVHLPSDSVERRTDFGFFYEPPVEISIHKPLPLPFFSFNFYTDLDNTFNKCFWKMLQFDILQL